ncbi:hypothetical protein OC834_004970, partial [Tilletia horrida]
QHHIDTRQLEEEEQAQNPPVSPQRFPEAADTISTGAATSTTLLSPFTPTFSPSWATIPLSPREEAQTRLLTALSASAARRRRKESDPELLSSRSRAFHNIDHEDAARRVSLPSIMGSPTAMQRQQQHEATESSSPATNASAMPIPSVRIEIEQDDADDDDDDDDDDNSSSKTGSDRPQPVLGVTPKSFAARRAARCAGPVRIPSLAQISRHVDQRAALAAATAGAGNSPSRSPSPSPARSPNRLPGFLSSHTRSVSSPASPTLLHTPFRTNDRGFQPDSSPCGQTAFDAEEMQTPRPGGGAGPLTESPPGREDCGSGSGSDSSDADSRHRRSSDEDLSSSMSSVEDEAEIPQSSGKGTVVHSTTNPPTSRGPPRPRPIRRPFSVSHQFGSIEVKLTPPTPMLAPLTPPPHHRAGPPPSPTLLTTPPFQLAPGHKLAQEQAEAFWKMWVAHAEAAAAASAGRSGGGKVVSVERIQKMQIEAARAAAKAKRRERREAAGLQKAEKEKEEEEEDEETRPVRAAHVGNNGLLAAPTAAQANAERFASASPVVFPSPMSATTPAAAAGSPTFSMSTGVPSYGDAVNSMLFPHFGTSPPAHVNQHMACYLAAATGTATGAESLQRTRSDSRGSVQPRVVRDKTNVGAPSWRISRSRPDVEDDKVEVKTEKEDEVEAVEIPRSAGPTYHRGVSVHKSNFDLRRSDSPPPLLHYPRRTGGGRGRPDSAGSDASTVIGGGGGGGGGVASWRSTPTVTPSGSPPLSLSSSSSSLCSLSKSSSSAGASVGPLPAKPSAEVIRGGGGGGGGSGGGGKKGGHAGDEYVASSASFTRRRTASTQQRQRQQQRSETDPSSMVSPGKVSSGPNDGHERRAMNARRSSTLAVSTTGGGGAGGSGGEYVASSASFSRTRGGARTAAAALKRANSNSTSTATGST